MAAAMKDDNLNATFVTIRTILAELQGQCENLVQLEVDSVDARRRVERIHQNAQRLKFSQKEDRGATMNIVQELRDAFYDFEDFVSNRDDRRGDAEHIRGRREIGKEFREAVQKAIEYFEYKVASSRSMDLRIARASEVTVTLDGRHSRPACPLKDNQRARAG